jgi:hypothetical protein
MTERSAQWMETVLVTRDRVDVALKLRGEKPASRLVLDAKATRSDPSHVVSVRSFREVDRQLVAWLRQAYDRAT